MKNYIYIAATATYSRGRLCYGSLYASNGVETVFAFTWDDMDKVQRWVNNLLRWSDAVVTNTINPYAEHMHEIVVTIRRSLPC